MSSVLHSTEIGTALPLQTPAVPSTRALARTLRDVTERIASEVAQPSSMTPVWSGTEWAIATAVAAMHGVSGLLASRTWRGPEVWSEFLREQHAHTRRCTLRQQHALRLLAEDAGAAGVALVPLKGAALHAAGTYGAGERPMADLDLLVEPANLARLVELMPRHGFVETGRTWKHLVFVAAGAPTAAPLGEHANNALKVEVHTHIAERLPLAAVDVSALVLPADPQPGINPYPTRSTLLLHLLLHAAGAMVLRNLRLIQLEDINRLARLMGPEEWVDLRRRAMRVSDPPLWWAFPPLALTQRYYRCVPHTLLAESAASCQWWLRRCARRRPLADVSTSALWIRAFPGIAWSRDAREALAYAAERIAPSVATRVQREQFALLQPRVSGGVWSKLSQRQRLRRWMFAPQPRQETLEPVRAALRSWTDSELTPAAPPRSLLRRSA
jgi:hypothetical protein